eukprot:CAMPEP_0183739618 /NCGR_PEP_ID=MMETSP0737-20130205/57514_1 /TAXON_ID=385413 /ORGANISM="Thalassiosira miniscula, Strain CCMP1093" /LENGTH=172 /DNA_ID=CAMNT_0025974461 /DNA_START=81 /DNA_END=600 /DNA_ORIENTATION=+
MSAATKRPTKTTGRQSMSQNMSPGYVNARGHLSRVPTAPFGDTPRGGIACTKDVSLSGVYVDPTRGWTSKEVNFASEPAQDFEAASFSVPATAVQSPGTPSGQDKTKRKRDRGGRRRRVADAKARKTEGGAKVVLTRHILAGDKNEKNNRTCLADAVAGLFPIGGFKKNSII